MSMKIFPTHHWCHVSDPHSATESCTIWQLGGVMALYKTGPDRARFFFDALEYYHQRLSHEFEIPTNQWITV